MNNRIEKMVQDYFDGALSIKAKILEGNDDNSHKFSAAKRLIISWKRYCVDETYKSDFELCLRDWLLLVKMPITIPSYKISQFASESLDMIQDGKKIVCKNIIPSYFNNPNYINDCLQNDINSKKNNKSSALKTSKYVKDLTGFEFYKSEEQKLAVIGSLNSPLGSTTLVSLSTGGGKSLISQTVAYQFKGLTLVIVPTISLMLDQVKNARAIIKTKDPNEIQCYYSEKSVNEIIKRINNGSIRLLFLSPEALIKNAALKKAVEDANTNGLLNNLIIDEAHIIVEWGASFRIDFQCIDAMQKKLLDSNKNLRTFLLSATFSKSTIDLLKKSFSDNDHAWIEIRCDSLRREPRYCFIKAGSSPEKVKKEIELILKLPHPMIVYVQSPKDAETVRDRLISIGLSNINIFTGETNNKNREDLIKNWSDNQFSIMVATCAFGVGVDKKDVRTVLHLYVPDNPNKYYQEAGRGGRDGLPCLSVLLYTEEDIDSAFSFAAKTLTTEKLSGRWFSMLNSSTSIKLGDNTVILDTATKPKYSENQLFIDRANQQDIEWNGKAVLMLKRYGLLNIESLDYDDTKYLFKVKVKANELFRNDEKSFSLFEKIREDESNLTLKEFSLMKNLLKHCDKTCVSETFCEIYGLAEEYCAGCNAHSNVINSSDYSFPLKKAILADSINNKNLEIFGFKNNILVLLDGADLFDIVQNIEATSVVTNNDISYQFDVNKFKNEFCNLFSLSEVEELEKDGNYFLGNFIAFVLSNNQRDIEETINMSKFLAEKFGIKCLFVCETDYETGFNYKKMSEVISGPCYSGQLFMEVIKNV